MNLNENELKNYVYSLTVPIQESKT